MFLNVHLSEFTGVGCETSESHSVVQFLQQRLSFPSCLVVLCPQHRPCIFSHFGCSSPAYRGASEGSVKAALENEGMTAACVYHVGYNGTPLEAARACIPIDPGSDTVTRQDRFLYGQDENSRLARSTPQALNLADMQ